MTSDETVKALRHCEGGNCTGCILRSDKQHCQERLIGSAADLIEQLEKEKAALLEYAKKSAGCAQCANYRPRCDVVDCSQCVEDCTCRKCKRGIKWEWKGLVD